jgi:hypothetical protein
MSDDTRDEPTGNTLLRSLTAMVEVFGEYAEDFEPDSEGLAVLEDARAAIAEGEAALAAGLKLDVIPTANGGYDIEAMVKAELETHGYVATLWHVTDVQEVRPDLTDAQAMETLRYAEHNHNAELGINWDILRIHADDLYPEPAGLGEPDEDAPELAPAQPEMDAP